MSFDDFDSGESLLGKSVKDMTGDDLLPYCVFMHKEVLGFKLIADPIKDRAVLRWLKKQYGQTAGLMVKWIFEHHKGYVDSGTFTINAFNSGHKWWIDKIYSEVNQRVIPVNRTKTIGFNSRQFVNAAIAS